MRYLSLDIVRALAILGVIARHSNVPHDWADWRDDPGVFLLQLLHEMPIGLDMFLVLSGFLNAKLLYEEQATRGDVSLGWFFVRRALRVWPGYFIALLATVLLTIAAGEHEPWTVWAGHVVFLQNYTGLTVNYPLWSVAYEEHAYLALMLVFFIVFKRRWVQPSFVIRGSLAILALALAARVVTGIAVTPYEWTIHFAQTHLRLDSFFVGVLLAALERAGLLAFLTPRRAWLLVGAAVTGIVLLPLTKLDDNYPMYTFGLTYLALLAGAFMIGVYTLEKQGRLAGMPRGLALVFTKLSAWSYALYLFHALVAELIERTWEIKSYVVAQLVFAVASIVSAWLLYEVMDRPLLRWRERISGERARAEREREREREGRGEGETEGETGTATGDANASRRLRYTAGASLAWLWLATRMLALFQLAPSNDVRIYFECASAMLAGRLPYSAQPFEYPPGALPIVLVPRIFSGDVASYAQAFAVQSMIVDGIVLLLVGALARRLGDTRRFAQYLYVLGGALLGELLLQRLDVYVAAIVTGALLLAVRAAPVVTATATQSVRSARSLRAVLPRAELLVAAGALVKLLPIVVLPALWCADAAFARAREARVVARFVVGRALWCCAAFALGVAPFIWLAPDGVLALVRFHAERGLQIESVPASVLLALRALGVIADDAVAVRFDHGAMHLTGPIADDVAALAGPLLAAALAVASAVVAVAALRLRQRWARARAAVEPDEDFTAARVDSVDSVAGAGVAGVASAAVLLGAAMLGSKVLSPQYFIWTLPLLAVLAAVAVIGVRATIALEAPARWMSRVAGLACALLFLQLLTGFIAKFGYAQLTALKPLAVLLLVLRNALLFGIVAWTARVLWVSAFPRRSVQTFQVRRVLLTPFVLTSATLAALAVVVLVVNLRDVDSTDFWLHRRIGADILATSSIPRFDVYSATARGAPFVAHEWLSAVILYLVDAALGSVGVVLLRVVAVAAVIALVIAATPRVLRSHPFAVPALLAVLSAVESRSEPRPHLLGLVMLAALAYAIARWHRTGRTRFAVLAVLLHVPWVNLHGGGAWIGPVLLALVGVAGAAAQMTNRWSASRTPGKPTPGEPPTPRTSRTPRTPRTRAWLACAAAALLACCINPRGPMLLWWTIHTSLLSPELREYIEEWQSTLRTWTPSFARLAFAAIVIAAVAALPALVRRRRVALAVPGAALVAMAWTAHRFQADAAVVLAPPVLLAVAVLARRLRLRVGRAGVGAVLLPLLLLLFVGGSPLGTGYGELPWRHVEALRTSTISGPIVNEYNDGGFLLAQLSPQFLVVMDGRIDMYGPERFSAYRSAWTSAASLLRYADEHKAVALWIAADDIALVSSLQAQPGWGFLGEDSGRALFVRR